VILAPTRRPDKRPAVAERAAWLRRFIQISFDFAPPCRLPHDTVNGEAGLQEVEITIGRLLRIVWLIFWRGALGAFLLGAIAGFVIGFIMGAAGLVQYVKIVTSIAGLVVGLFWWVFVIKMALQKHYSDFRIVLVSTDTEGIVKAF
jgi:hypothetical protein